jgi:hypothetical protein
MAVWRRWWWELRAALVLLAGLAGIGGPAVAQGRPHIDGVDVERVAELAPGTRLHFSVFGSPGGQVVVHIDGARHPLPLRELQPGVYDGSYRLEPGEHLAPDARVVAILRLGALETRALLDEPLLLDGSAMLPAPTVPGGSANGTAPVPAPTRSAAGEPVPQPQPQQPQPPAPAPMPPGAAPLPDPGDTRPAPPSPIDFPPPTRPTPAPCADCAVVESIRPLQVDDRPPASAAGSLLGGLFGERVGQAVDRHVARVSGAVERAVRGRSLDEPSGPGVEVVLRLPNGQRLVRLYDRAPDLRVGDSVRRGADLGGARSERLLDAPPAPQRNPRPRGEQWAGSQAP